MRAEESLAEIRISPDQTDAFVERLVSDEAFRHALEERPAETLAEYDIRLSPDVLVHPVKLAAPEDIERARATMDTGEFSPEWVKSSESRFAAIFRRFRRFKRLIFRK
jgi:putative modified peptide